MIEGNKWDAVRASVDEAKMMLRAVDSQVETMAELLCGRLRLLKSFRGVDALRTLKRELRDFNGTTGKWRGDRDG